MLLLAGHLGDRRPPVRTSDEREFIESREKAERKPGATFEVKLGGGCSLAQAEAAVAAPGNLRRSRQGAPLVARSEPNPARCPAAGSGRTGEPPRPHLRLPGRIRPHHRRVHRCAGARGNGADRGRGLRRPYPSACCTWRVPDAWSLTGARTRVVRLREGHLRVRVTGADRSAPVSRRGVAPVIGGQSRIAFVGSAPQGRALSAWWKHRPTAATGRTTGLAARPPRDVGPRRGSAAEGPPRCSPPCSPPSA